MPTKSNNTGGRGGRRPGAGRKKTAVKEKYENGNPGGRDLTVLDIPDVEGEDMPTPHDFLSAKQHDGSTLEAGDIYRETWEWLDKLGVAKAVSPQLLERYAMCSARWIQCEEMTTRLGYLSKHPTTGKPIPSPFINIGIMDYKGNVTVKIDALAASAASVIAMAGTKVCMSPVAMLMIHNPATIAIGDTEEMQKAIDMLSEVKESIMNAYEIKSGLSRAKISKLMDAETWMNAKEARKLGFADEVLFAGGENPLPEEDDTIEMLFSRKAVTDSLLSRLIPKKKPEADKHMVPVIDLEKRLSLLAH
ncbi:MAG: ATP-dependent Clp protease proteolytic subunit [Eubacterium sp.]|nr:ATP-dependent Clp protease proteolytic subunit [Eubacterium sp.]